MSTLSSVFLGSLRFTSSKYLCTSIVALIGSPAFSILFWKRQTKPRSCSLWRFVGVTCIAHLFASSGRCSLLSFRHMFPNLGAPFLHLGLPPVHCVFLSSQTSIPQTTCFQALFNQKRCELPCNNHNSSFRWPQSGARTSEKQKPAAQRGASKSTHQSNLAV